MVTKTAEKETAKVSNSTEATTSSEPAKTAEPAKATKTAKPAKGATVKVTLIRSMHGRLKNHQACARGLGLRRMHHTVEVIDTPQNRGMMNKISYMLKCEPS